MSSGGMLGSVIGMAVGAYMVAALIPGAVSTITAANTSGWGTAEAALWPMMGVILVVGCFIMFLGQAGVRM